MKRERERRGGRGREEGGKGRDGVLRSAADLSTKGRAKERSEKARRRRRRSKIEPIIPDEEENGTSGESRREKERRGSQEIGKLSTRSRGGEDVKQLGFEARAVVKRSCSMRIPTQLRKKAVPRAVSPASHEALSRSIAAFTRKLTSMPRTRRRCPPLSLFISKELSLDF